MVPVIPRALVSAQKAQRRRRPSARKPRRGPPLPGPRPAMAMEGRKKEISSHLDEKWMISG